MSFFKRPIITGEWHTGIDTFVFKAFQKNDRQVIINIYKKRWINALSTHVIADMTISTSDFYNKFVPNLNAVETVEVHIRRDVTTYDDNAIIKQSPQYNNTTLLGKWTCDEADKRRVLANMPENIETAEVVSEGGNKRSGKKRSGKKRSGKKRKSHKRGHKKSRRRH